MTIHQYRKLLKQRQRLEAAEQKIEEEIYSVDGPSRDVEEVIADYIRAKEERQNSSVETARAFMKLSSKDRAKLIETWKDS